MNDQTAVNYLGKKLFDLYKEKHPEVTEETKVQQINQDQMQYGFQIPKPQQYSVFDLSPYAPMPELVTVTREQFEIWAESKDSKFHRMAYAEELDTLYVFSYYPRF